MNNFHRKNQPRPTSLILGTALALVAIFLVIIGLFILFSSASPALVGRCVAVVDINTPLTIEGAPPTLFSAGYPSSEDIASTVDSLNKRGDVGAVVFVINSPGGSVVASKEVYDSVKELDKPSVAYFREVAASGAYYIAAGTDYIVSDPNALTGSIGVIATVTQMSGLFDKLGVNVTTIKSGEYKDIGSMSRNMTDGEQQILQGLVDEVYEEFRNVVLENRKGKLDMQQFENVTDGRILSGRQAKNAGLVDELGSKDDAIMKAAELAEIPAESIEEVRVCYAPTMASEGGLFSAEAFLKYLSLDSQNTRIMYK